MKALIAGYYGFGNLGDELILSAVKSQIQARYGDVALTVLSEDPEETRRTHGVNAVSRWNPISIVRQLWQNDFLILGGGGLLQNKTSQQSLLYYLGLIGAARFMHCPVILYAMGVETLEGKFSQALTKFFLSSPGVTITVRDEASKNILSSIGLSKSIYITADPVFSRTADLPPRERYAAISGSALLIPRFPCPPAGRRLFAIISRILRDEKKMRVRGLLFEPKSEVAHLKNFNGEAILSEDDFISGLSIEEMAQSMHGYDWIISARFHGLVLAAMAGRPFIGLGDPHKVGRICGLLKMPFLPWDADEAAVQKAIQKMLLKNMGPQSDLIDRLRDASLQTANYVK